jgi:hypothetical protein
VIRPFFVSAHFEQEGLTGSLAGLSPQRARRPFWAFLEYLRLSLPHGPYGRASGEGNNGRREKKFRDPSAAVAARRRSTSGVWDLPRLYSRARYLTRGSFCAGIRCAALPVLCMSRSDFIPYPFTSSSALLSPPHLPAQCRCRTSLVILVHAHANTSGFEPVQWWR